ncbi:NAD(P)/FAD-dependent oxidoreductase [Mesorhizobium sp. L48C026A00]|uniref:NAD(P)/FAD-dependent oxidoreductase n=1 Tax=Mesorhizobium sp. L48C026A00 TaxID=1287182 RepID=UPI0003CFC187|nr:NAD(P)/FAD-dependent oxidoreductase [Mesorhizobium sp. L48C026A00]ESZ19617.1 FAD-dependent pyridine nucleotide-disulfide oxidoreductase [Mesorhizobium sp. L48C026A00]
MNNLQLDCLIIGGGPAGLAAATYLARFRRRALVIDAGRSRANWISSIRNYPGFPGGISGLQLLGDMHAQAKRFGARIESGTVSAIERSEDGFLVTASDRMFRAATLLIAAGVEDNLPDVPGFSVELIVRDKIRLCPVCDAFEFYGRRIAVWGEGERSVKEALFLRTYCDAITVLVASGNIGASDRERLAAAGVETLEIPVVRLEEREDGIALVQTDGRTRRFEGIYLAMGSTPRAGLAVALGAEVNMADCLLVDAHQETTAPGLYSAGDIVDELNQITVAVGHAAIAATAIHNKNRRAAARTFVGATPDYSSSGVSQACVRNHCGASAHRLLGDRQRLVTCCGSRS